MKFHSEVIWTPEEGSYVIKTYYCPNCHYKRQIKDKSGEIIPIEGDKEFVLFPFFSLRQANGEHAELVACPHCHTVQYVERVEDKRETDYVLH